MRAFRFLLGVIFAVVAVCTLVVVADHGFNSFPLSFSAPTEPASGGQPPEVRLHPTF